MKAFSTIPDGYREIYSVNLQRDKKPAFLINAAAIAVGVAMTLIAHFAICPITSLFDMSAGLGEYFLRFLVLAGGSFVYIILHEATHGAAMKLWGHQYENMRNKKGEVRLYGALCLCGL